MKKLLILVALAFPAASFAQHDKDQHTKFVFESSLPEELYKLYYHWKVRTTYSIRSDVNPFYLTGDFDGDGYDDFALGVIDKATGKKGVLVLHTGTKAHYIFGAGNALPHGGGDDYTWMDVWKVYEDDALPTVVGLNGKITLKGDAIHAVKLESASGLFYWTGTEYEWHQLGD